MRINREQEKILLDFRRFCRSGNRRAGNRPAGNPACPAPRPGNDTLCLNKGIVFTGTVLFLSGLFIPSVATYPSGTVVPVFTANPSFAGIYAILALAALAFVLLDDLVLPAAIGTTLGLYLVIIGVSAVLDGSLGVGFLVPATGVLLLVTGCFYPGT
jgi:hypothetical protein